MSPGPDVRTSVSIHRAHLPAPGPAAHVFVWDDVLGSPPPAAADLSLAGRFVVRHGFDEDADPEARVGFATVIAVRGDGGEWRLDVDERLVLERRILPRVLRAEHRVSRSIERGARMGGKFVESGSAALARRMPGTSGVVVTRGSGLAMRSLAWVFETLRDGVRTLLHAPDRLVVGAGSAGAHLGERGSRRMILRGLADPYSLTREGKAAALFIAGALVLALGLAATLAVVFVAPQSTPAWRAIVSYFSVGVAGTLLFPFFPEFQLADVARAVGAPIAILTISLGMTTGAWLVLFLGDAIHGTLRRSVRPGSPLGRLLVRAEEFAKRRGFWAAFLPLCIPLGPDTPIFYILATMRTPPRQLLLGTFLGTLVRFSLYHAITGGFRLA